MLKLEFAKFMFRHDLFGKKPNTIRPLEYLSAFDDFDHGFF